MGMGQRETGREARHMILIRNLRLEPGEPLDALRQKAAKKLRVPEGDITDCVPVKRSLDARKKTDIHYSCSAAVTLRRGEEKAMQRAGKDAAPYLPPVYEIPPVTPKERPVVVGFGPAGMFAALVLAKAGARPIVLERGQAQRPVRRGRGRHLLGRKAQHRHPRQTHVLGPAGVCRPRRAGERDL